MLDLTRTRVARSVVARATALPGRGVFGNLIARVVALAAVAIVTILVAREGGADDVGLLALMRVLPGVIGMLAACGLSSAVGYFIGGPERDHPRLWPTVHVIMAAGAVGGALVWFALTPIIHHRLMTTTTSAVVAAVGVTVATQVPVGVAKACLQALGDSRGASIVIAAEEAAFLPAYALGWAFGLRSGWLLVTALFIADVVVAVGAWVRIVQRVRAGGTAHARQLGRPDRDLGARVVRFGLRSQVGGVVSLLNLRLDVVILGSFANPVTVGVYVVASKYAELLRLPAVALTWVAYPAVARQGTADFTRRAGRAVSVLLPVGLVAAAVLALSAFPLLPLVYGHQFTDARWPAAWIALGLIAEPAAGLASAYLMGTGRPGTNSLILGVGLAITVVLDFLLIPMYGALGAAVASALAYLSTDIVLLGAMRHGIRTREAPA